jgi:hypothetical protein
MMYRLTIGMITFFVSNVALTAQTPEIQDAVEKKLNQLRNVPLQKNLRKARRDGKYEMLLRQIYAPADREKYSDFYDLGRNKLKDVAGPLFKDVPDGYWVYVYPYWYIWHDLAGQRKQKRAWGTEQLIGPPDTPQAGDCQTAWASATQDGADEWLLLEYAEPVLPTKVMVYETYNPGALVRVTAFRLDGEEVELWKGKDPTPKGTDKGVSEIAVKTDFKTNRINLYIDSKNTPGWNEIDAVGLRDAAGETHWVTAAHASSTYAEQGGAGQGNVIIFQPVALPAGAVPMVPAPRPAAPAKMPAPVAVPNAKDQRIKQLEKENQELKDAIKKLEQRLGDKR